MGCEDRVALRALFPSPLLRVSATWLWCVVAFLPAALLFALIFFILCSRKRPFAVVTGPGLHTAAAVACTAALATLAWQAFDTVAAADCELPDSCACAGISEARLSGALVWRPLGVAVGVLLGSAAHTNHFLRRELRLLFASVGASASAVFGALAAWQQRACDDAEASGCACGAGAWRALCGAPLLALGLFTAAAGAATLFPMRSAWSPWPAAAAAAGAPVTARTTATSAVAMCVPIAMRRVVDPTAPYVSCAATPAGCA